MPRDNKTPLIQRIATQAHRTFSGSDPAACGGEEEDFSQKHCELEALMTALRAADLKLAPRSGAAGSNPDAANPPVTYMHICETDAFSMGVFTLSSGASIPLHDHPSMHGMLKVLYGKVSIRCFDKLDQGASATEPPVFAPPLASRQRGSLRRARLRSVGEYSEGSGPCLLTPLRDNLHQIDALDGPAAFLDILAPPYDSDDGRDCHYYRVLSRHGAEQQDGPEEKEQDKNQEQDQNQNQEQDQEKETETWLLEIPQPEDFWCGGESYPGPTVSVQKRNIK
ncbi:2-aminoethanethiol (cysteamine) dioxygenase a [Gadus morhua]|uniref:2-aminoethanethiol (cysteamine) dioxygenase a n=1 Tax=Gadus morhua TaxID=8049 RepID=UPI0011B38E4C|nr:2-aminoethanethiol dioxygenase [Gadus morhua]